MSAVTEVDLKLNSGDDREAVFDTEPIQIMRIRLEPGDSLPRHRANSNVLLVPLEGTVSVQEDDGLFHNASPGHALKVEYRTPMLVSNAGDEPLTFLVLKTPHPKVIAREE